MANNNILKNSNNILKNRSHHSSRPWSTSTINRKPGPVFDRLSSTSSKFPRVGSTPTPILTKNLFPARSFKIPLTWPSTTKLRSPLFPLLRSRLRKNHLLLNQRNLAPWEIQNKHPHDLVGVEIRNSAAALRMGNSKKWTARDTLLKCRAARADW